MDTNERPGNGRALIMEGGAMRGMFTCGIIDVFLEEGITFDGAAGISAGAIFGCNLKSNQPGRALRYNKKYCADPRYCSIRSLIMTGDLYGADFCYRELPDKLDIFDREAFCKNPLKFYIGATDVKTGKAVYHLCSDGGKRDLLWMRASASMPAVSRVVAADGYELLDGGIADAVPYEFMEKQGYTRNVIVLTQPEGYRKEKSRGMAFFRLMLRKYPAVIRAMESRHEMYNRQLDEIRMREEQKAAIVLRPPEPLAIKRTEKDPRELQRVYDIGRRAALYRLPEIKAFLK